MRLGDLDALMHRFMDKPPEYYHTSYIVGEINAAPTVDAVPVVRCKDCKYYPDGNGTTKWLPCREMITREKWFCADGERRDKT